MSFLHITALLHEVISVYLMKCVFSIYQSAFIGQVSKAFLSQVICTTIWAGFYFYFFYFFQLYFFSFPFPFFFLWLWSVYFIMCRSFLLSKLEWFHIIIIWERASKCTLWSDKATIIMLLHAHFATLLKWNVQLVALKAHSVLSETDDCESGNVWLCRLLYISWLFRNEMSAEWH